MQSTVRPSPLSSLQQVEEAQLMRHVEGRGRLVEQQELRLLHERLRQHDELLLAARELREAAVGQLGDAETRQRQLGVAARVRVLAATVGAHLDDLAHGEVEVEGEVLRHQRDLAGHLRGGGTCASARR